MLSMNDNYSYIPLHAGTQELLNDYLDEARHAADTEGALFRPVSNNRTGKLDDTVTPDGVYKLVRRYAPALGLKIVPTHCVPHGGFSVFHSRLIREKTRKILSIKESSVPHGCGATLSRSVRSPST